MTDCTERHTAALVPGLSGEGQKGMPKEGSVMSLEGQFGRSRAGRQGMTREVQS